MAGPEPPVSPLAFAGVAIVSLGGPLALVALFVPNLLAGVSGSAGLVTVAGGLAFLAPLAIWMRYAAAVSGPAGLTGFVRAAAGPRTALVHAAVWITSYLLYLVYTTAYIVYDLLPEVLPGERRYRVPLELALPVVIAAVLLAGRKVTLAVLGVLAAVQMVLVGLLAILALRHGGYPVGAFAVRGTPGTLAVTAGNAALLYVCGSLPLYLGGELARPARTVRRVLSVCYGIAALAVVVAVVPMATDPGLLATPVPGVALAAAYSAGLGTVVATGVAASEAGLMVVEYLALGRLLSVLTRWPVRRTNLLLAAVLVLTAPLSLADPAFFYRELLKPSLVALWLSQLAVAVGYPRFAARQRGRMCRADIALAGAATALLLFGLYSSIANQVAS